VFIGKTDRDTTGKLQKQDKNKLNMQFVVYREKIKVWCRV